MWSFLFVGVGGACGAMCRYGIGLLAFEEPAGFPIKTLLINILGSFLIGVLAALTVKHPNMDQRWMLLLKTGFCGGFTTFSTFALESWQLYGGGKWKLAGLYMTVSLLIALVALLTGEWLVRQT